MSLTFYRGEALTGVQLVSSFEAMDSKLAPVKINAQRRVIPEGDKQRVAYWRVTLGRRITRGSKIRRFFKSYADAKKFVEDSLDSKVERGIRHCAGASRRSEAMSATAGTGGRKRRAPADAH